MEKINITNDRTLAGLKSKPAGDYFDKTIPGFGVRLSPQGRRTFILVARFGNAKNPTRRAIGLYDAMNVEAARAKARSWIEIVRRGDDPAQIEERERLAAERKRSNLFASVAEDFIREKLPNERNGKEVERLFRRHLIPAWGKSAIVDLSRHDVRALIEEKKRTAPVQARNTLSIIKRFFSWAIDTERYGLEVSPAESLKASKLIGKKNSRLRILSEAHATVASPIWEAMGAIDCADDSGASSTRQRAWYFPGAVDWRSRGFFPNLRIVASGVAKSK
jgi:hypothetical protein